MIVGLDLSVLQTPHRLRGIGAVAKEFVNNISDDDKKNNKFILFLYQEDQNLALELLNLNEINYEIRFIKKYKPVSLPLPWKFKKINGLINTVRELYVAEFGEKKIINAKDIVSFIQFDQMVALPKLDKNTKKVMIIYDIIPYVLKNSYLWDYKIARNNGSNILSALRREYLRKIFKLKLKANCRNADTLISISKYTKNDFVKHINVSADKIKVVYLGVDKPLNISYMAYPGFKNYIENSWGYIQKDIDLRTKRFLLFIGGIDPRRKINDLVAAYNMLKAQGHDIRLVMAGDVMISPNNFPELESRKYISESSYLEDIIFLGYISNIQKKWLYKNALAFVYPSIYEGFGLPILESLINNNLVLTYNNSSIKELSEQNSLIYFANNYSDIYKYLITIIIPDYDNEKSNPRDIIHKILNKFSWTEFSSKILRLT